MAEGPTIPTCPTCGDELAIFGPHGRRECVGCGWIGTAAQVVHRAAKPARAAAPTTEPVAA